MSRSELAQNVTPDEAARWLRGATSAGDPLSWAVQIVLNEFARRGVNLADREDAARVAVEAAARIDTAFSHGVPCGSEDPVTAVDWMLLLQYARCGGTERPVRGAGVSA